MGFPERESGGRAGGGGIGLPDWLIGGRGGAVRRAGSPAGGRGGADDGWADVGWVDVGWADAAGRSGGVEGMSLVGAAGAAGGGVGVPVDRTRRLAGAGGASLVVGSIGASSAAGAAAAFLAGAFFAAAAFFAGLAGSSGWTSRRSPSASAFLRTRSAWASSIDDEWLLTPIPSETAKSSASLFVRPNSRASS